jgi:hypothetical protein
MKIPFTIEQLFSVFETYNTAIWPSQIAAYVFGIVALGLALREGRLSDKIISGILALFWIWIGVFYYIIHFSVINPAAPMLGLFYVLQGTLFLLTGTIRGRLSFRFNGETLPILGGCFILYAMVIYPLLGLGFGHSYPRAGMFGVAPCPTSIFTFGMLLWAIKPVPAYLLIIPLLWSFFGIIAAVNWRVHEDYGLVVAGVLGTILILIRNRKVKESAQQITSADGS